MGIPSFYAWLKRRYPLILYQMQEDTKEKPIFDNLYIDFNALIYRCVKEENHFLMDQLNPRSFEDIYNRVVEYVDYLIDFVDPRKFLFISLDGVVPRAKVNQSRERRFKAGRRMNSMSGFFQDIGVEDKENFQGNSISPGTEFLYTLCSKLKVYILGKMDHDWKHLQVVFSDCCVPGEGEQKIMEFLRAARKYSLFNENSTHCIYSPDADFFLLALSSRFKNVCTVREEYAWSEDRTEPKIRKPLKVRFEFVMVNILRQYFELEFQDIRDQVKNFDIYRVIDDFILIMMFVGNDFLPRLFCFNIREGHLSDLLSKYKQYLLHREGYINNLGEIDWKNIESLMEIAKQFEVQMLKEKLKRDTRTESENQSQGNGHSPTIAEDMELDEMKNFEIEDDHIVKGRNYYYKSRFEIDIEQNPQELEKIVVKYIEGIEFYCKYYYQGCPAWGWFYPYHYTPLLCDVHNYIHDKKITSVKIGEKGQPFDPILALMFMVPVASFKLLPGAVQEVLKDPACILRSPEDFYPEDFEMDKFTSAKDFDQKAMIPFLDEKMVKEVYAKIPRDKYTQAQKDRNTKANALYFRRVGEGNMERTAGAEINFLRENDMSEMKKTFIAPSAEIRQRFPSIKMYGQIVQIKKEGFSIVVKNRLTKIHEGQLIFFNHFQGYVEQVVICDRSAQDKLTECYSKLGIIGECNNYYRVKLARLVRGKDGYHLTRTLREVFVPDFMAFEVPDYDYLRKKQVFSDEDNLRVGEKVTVLRSEEFGWSGVVKSIEGTAAEVKITEMPQLPAKIEQLDIPFYTFKSVCQTLKVHREVLLSIMDEIIVKPNKAQKYGNLLPDEFNIGLFIINRKNALLVPQYVRVPLEYEDTQRPHVVFDYLEISETGLQLIKKYLSDFPDVVEAVIHEFNKNKTFKGTLSLRNIFLEKEAEQNVELLKIYRKLYDYPSHGVFCKIYSKVAGNEANFAAQELASSTIKVPLCYLRSKRQSRVAPVPWLPREPEYHDIGDRVLILRTLESGVIVGVNDIYVIVKVNNKREMMYEFREVFNQKWAEVLQKESKEVWNGEYSYYSPSFWSKAVQLTP